MDKRETELLEEIARLNNQLRRLGELNDNFNSSRREENQGYNLSRHSSKENFNEKHQLNAIKTLQSVLRGHVDRKNLVKENSRSRSVSLQRYSRSPSPFNEDKFYRTKHMDSYEEMDDSPERFHRQKSKKPMRDFSPQRYSPELSRNLSRSPPRDNRREPYNRRSSPFRQTHGYQVSDSDNEHSESKKLIEQKEVAKTDGGACCSPFRRKNK